MVAFLSEDPSHFRLIHDIKSLHLACSLDNFFRTFLDNDAPYSLDHFQREYIRDCDVTITRWESGNEESHYRTITFSHPIRSIVGVGPSMAFTTRKQRLQRYDQYGICIENITRVEGFPSADAFFVQDCWLIEAISETQIQVSTRYDVRFTRRAILKSIIQNSIRKETKYWFNTYAKMIQTVFQRDGGTGLAPINETLEASPVDGSLVKIQNILRDLFRLLLILGVTIIFLLLALTWQLYSRM